VLPVEKESAMEISVQLVITKELNLDYH